MSDVIFIAATIVFYGTCALYVNWCDRIVGPDDFKTEAFNNDVARTEVLKVDVPGDLTR
jgi:hypothetical protein